MIIITIDIFLSNTDYLYNLTDGSQYVVANIFYPEYKVQEENWGSGTHLESFKPVLTYMGVYLGNKQTAGSRNAMAGSFPWAIGDRDGWPNLVHTRARNKEPVCNDLEDKAQHDLGSQVQIGATSQFIFSILNQFQHIQMLNF